MTRMCPQIRDLFIIILMFCEPSNLRQLYDQYWSTRCDDIEQMAVQKGTILTEAQEKTLVLLDLEMKLQSHEKTLKNFGLRDISDNDSPVKSKITLTQSKTANLFSDDEMAQPSGSSRFVGTSHSNSTINNMSLNSINTSVQKRVASGNKSVNIFTNVSLVQTNNIVNDTPPPAQSQMSPSPEQQHDEAMGEKTTKQAKKSLITKSSHSNFGDKEEEHKKHRGKSIVWDLAEEYGSKEQFQTSETFKIIKQDYAKHRNRNGVINYVCKYAKKKVRKALKKTNMHNNIVIFRVSFIKKNIFRDSIVKQKYELKRKLMDHTRFSLHQTNQSTTMI